MTDKEKFLNLMKDLNLSTSEVDYVKTEENEVVYVIDDIQYVLAGFIFSGSGKFVKIISEP